MPSPMRVWDVPPTLAPGANSIYWLSVAKLPGTPSASLLFSWQPRYWPFAGLEQEFPSALWVFQAIWVALGFTFSSVKLWS